MGGRPDLGGFEAALLDVFGDPRGEGGAVLDRPGKTLDKLYDVG